jgi:hypothetical protein
MTSMVSVAVSYRSAQLEISDIRSAPNIDRGHVRSCLRNLAFRKKGRCAKGMSQGSRVRLRCIGIDYLYGLVALQQVVVPRFLEPSHLLRCSIQCCDIGRPGGSIRVSILIESSSRIPTRSSIRHCSCHGSSTLLGEMLGDAIVRYVLSGLSARSISRRL